MMENNFKEWLKEKSLVEREISQLPPYIVENIKDNICSSDLDRFMSNNNCYKKNSCHNNAILAAETIKLENAENRIVEGFVLCEDGLFFEHIWNRIICNNDKHDFDVTFSVIASEAEKNAKKTYYEYKNWSFAEMLERKNTSNLAFSQESDSIISDYYDNVNSEHKGRYYQSKEILQNEHRRI